MGSEMCPSLPRTCTLVSSSSCMAKRLGAAGGTSPTPAPPGDLGASTTGASDGFWSNNESSTLTFSLVAPTCSHTHPTSQPPGECAL